MDAPPSRSNGTRTPAATIDAPAASVNAVLRDQPRCAGSPRPRRRKTLIGCPSLSPAYPPSWPASRGRPTRQRRPTNRFASVLRAEVFPLDLAARRVERRTHSAGADRHPCVGSPGPQPGGKGANCSGQSARRRVAAGGSEPVGSVRLKVASVFAAAALVAAISPGHASGPPLRAGANRQAPPTPIAVVADTHVTGVSRGARSDIFPTAPGCPPCT